VADERVSVVIDIDVKDQRQIALLQTQLLALGRQGTATEKAMGGLAGKMGLSNTQVTTNSKGAKQLVRDLTLLEKVGGKALKMARVVTYAVIGMGLEFAVTALSLASVNAAFALGKIAMQAYRWGMQAVAGGLAAIGAAAIAAAAAFGEFQAAQYAFNYKDSKTLGTGLEQSADAMRMMMTNATLASYGIKSLSSAYATASKNAKVDGKMIKQLEAMADFVSAGPNQDKQLQGAANFLSLIQRGAKANTDFAGELKAAAQEVGPAFSNLFKGNNVGDTGKLLQDLMSGKLAKKAGVAGQADTVAGTIFGKFKGMVTAMYVELGDVGRRMLAPLSDAMDKIFAGLRQSFRRLSGDFAAFGRGGVLPAMVNLAAKTEEFSINLFRKFLPAAAGWWKRTGDAFKGFAAEFRDVRDSLAPLREGGSVLIKTFGLPLVQIFKSIGDNVKHLANLGVKNKDIYKQFGERLKGIVEAFFNMGSATKEAFVIALPVINKVLDAIATIINAVAKVLRLLSGLGSFGGAAGIAGMSYLAYKGRNANRQQRVKSGANRGKVIVNPDEFVGSGLTMPTMEAPSADRAMSDALGVGGRMGTPGPGLMEQITSHSDNVKSAKVIGDAIAEGKSTKSKAVDAVKKATDATKDAVSTKVSRMTVFAENVSVRNGNRGGGGGGRPKIYDGKTPQGLPLFKEQVHGPTGRIDYSPTNRSPNHTGVNGYGVLAMEGMADANRKQANKEGMWRNLFNKTPKANTPFDISGNPQPVTRFPGTNIPMSSFKRKAMEMGLGGDPGRILRMQEERTASGRLKRAGGFLRRIPGAIKASAQNSAVGTRRYLGQVPGKAKEMYWGGARPDLPSIGDAKGVSGKMGAIGARFGVGGQVTAGTGTGPGASFNTGLRARLGRGLFGQNFGTEGFKMSGIFGGGGGNFGEGMKIERLRQLEAGEKLSRGKMAKAGIKNSMSGMGALAGVGTDLFLNTGMGKKMMGDPDAQNSMRTGAALMAINPLLGLGVGLGGAAMNAKTTKGGAMAGALSGAAIGGMIGPWGAVIGAGIGAVVGMAFAKKNQTKMAKKGAEAVANSNMFKIATSAIEEGLKSGTTKNARKELAGFTKFATDFNATGGKNEAESKANRGKRQEMMKGYLDSGVIDKTTYDLMTSSHADDDARKQMMKTSDDMNKALTPAFDQFDNIMSSLKLSTGMTSEEIVTLATKMNVNLYDPTIKLEDAVVKLGAGMIKTADQFNQALRDVGVKSLSVFDKFTKKKEMQDAIQSAGNKLRGGDTSTEAYMDYYTKAMDFQNYENPNDPLGNFLARQKEFQSGAAYEKGGALYGVKRNAEFDGLAKQALTQEQTDLAKTMTTQLGSKLTGAGVNFEDAEGASAMMQGKIGELLTKAGSGDKTAIAELTSLQSTLSGSGNIFTKDNSNNAKILSNLLGGTAEGANTKNLGSSFGGFKLGADKTGAEANKQLTETQSTIRDGFLEAINSGLMSATSQPEWWNNTPSWWAEGLKIEDNKIVPADTSSPRAGAIGDTSVSKTLGRTMGRHNYFNGLVSGKRNVTSSWRNYGLGSPSSDHVTGNAYDLTGQNLGMYASLINTSGGFAEFHGSAGSRHLHVVPPPSPMGDTSSGRMGSVGASPTSSTYEGDSFNITVVESKDAKATAQEVVRQIAEIQKTWRRRS
jgi:hypothetical protein